MALTGNGIVPSGTTGTELTYVTRRGFVPKLIDQLYKSRPLLSLLLENANMGTGGVSQVTIPVQGNPYVEFQWAGWPGNFDGPEQLNGTSLAEFNYKMGLVPIPFFGLEGLIQMDHSVIPLIEARMNDAEQVIKQSLSSALFTNTAAINAEALTGLPAAVDDATNVDSYGNITRSANDWWKAAYKVRTPSADPTRYLVLEDVINVTSRTGEMPTAGFMGFGTWAKLAQDFLGLERYPRNGDDYSAKSAFMAIEVAGVPIYADPDCDEGRLYLLNNNYLGLSIHEQAAFSFTGFESLVPNNQLGYVGVIVMVMELINAKCKASGQIRGYNSTTF